MSIRKFTSKKKYNHDKNINFRNEKKILFFESENFLKNFLKVNSFKQIYNERYINSIYFDDHNLTNLLETIDGEKYRSKIRLRWYGRNKIINPRIEIKKKNMFLTTKSFKKILFTGRYPDNKSLTQINKKLHSFSPFLINYYPKTSTHYLRHYFISKNKKIRATIDEKIYYRNINNLNIDLFKKKDFNLILEFKYNKSFDDYVKNSFTKNNCLRISKNSKFINSFFF